MGHKGYHTRYHAFFLSLAWFGGYLRQVTTRYSHVFKKNINIYLFLINLMVTHGNLLQIASKLC